jgi:hypothetical protein
VIGRAAGIRTGAATEAIVSAPRRPDIIRRSPNRFAETIAMPFDRNAGGHAFGFSDDKCQKCDMTRKYFQDHGEPRCTGRKPERREGMPIADD